MKTSNSIITIHMVASLDGFIAKEDNSVEWFNTASQYEKGEEPESGEEFLKHVDCFVMGAKTYEHAYELSSNYGWPYGDVPTVVVSHRKLPVSRNNISFYSGDLEKLVNEDLKLRYNNIWVAGGARLVKEFLRLQLADEIRLSILPIILGGGVPFFDELGQEIFLNLKGTKAFNNGMMELWYEIRK